MSSRAERNNLICIDPHAGRRIRLIQSEIDDFNRAEQIKRAAVYVGLAAFCFGFWGVVIWGITR